MSRLFLSSAEIMYKLFSTNSVDPDQTKSVEVVWSGSTRFTYTNQIDPVGVV